MRSTCSLYIELFGKSAIGQPEVSSGRLTRRLAEPPTRIAICGLSKSKHLADMTRAIVTGGAGFVGANMIRRLLADGFQVHAFLRPGTDRWRLADIADEFAAHAIDLSDQSAVDSAMRRIRPQFVFHLAAHGAYPSQSDTRRMVSANLLGTVNLVEAALAAGVESLVNAGSSSEYGVKHHPPPETDWLEPNSPYAVTKAAATLYCRHRGQVTGAALTTLRLYSVYGPYEERSRLIPKLLSHGLLGRLPDLAQPDTARDFIYIDDVLDAFLSVARSRILAPGSVYNLGTGQQTTIRKLVQLVRGLLGLHEEPRWGSMQARNWDTTHWVANPNRLREDLNWMPKVELADGLQQTLQWLERNQDIHAYYASA
jgi:UDP-glucose 4-epimerase